MYPIINPKDNLCNQKVHFHTTLRNISIYQQLAKTNVKSVLAGMRATV